MACCVKGEARDENHRDSPHDLRYAAITGTVPMILFYRFHNTEGTFAEVLPTCIATQFHRSAARHLGKKHGLARRHEFIEERTDIYLVRQRIIGHNNIPHPVVGNMQFQTYQSFPEAGDNGKRQFFQLLRSELSLDLAYLLPQLILTHEPLSLP